MPPRAGDENVIIMIMVASNEASIVIIQDVNSHSIEKCIVHLVESELHVFVTVEHVRVDLEIEATIFAACSF